LNQSIKKIVSLAIVPCVALAGCATSSKDIAPTYVSPMQYANFDCDQLQAESQRIQGRVIQLGGRLDEASSNDKVLMGVGLVVFWPALFFLGGTKQQEAEYARLKGEYDAVQQAAVQKRCTGMVASAKPAPASESAGAPPSSGASR
jgi:hypothetical protein